VKKRALYFVIMLALALCMTLPMTTPVMASQISGTKNTIPALPNMYRIGDTIYYVMTVTNPVLNTANNTLTRIWDTLPNGTVIDFLGPGETLVQPPGNTTTFYVNYTVAAIDVVWLPGPQYYGVKNTFEAEGYDSAGGDVYVLVTKNSQIIQPDIDVEKYVWDGAGWQDADTTTGPYLPSTQNPVIFRFDIDNTGDVDLTNVSLTDTDMMAFYTDQACTISAVFPISTLYHDDPIVTVYGKLAFAPGQHSNSVTVTGTPPVGAPVSDSDPAYYFGSGASIDLEKAVWDGVTWQDADIATGPYLVSGPVVFRFVITNNGNVNLTNVTLSDLPAIGTFYTNQGLTTAATLPIPTLAANASVTVYGSLPWVAGQQIDTATATGTPPVGAPVSDSDPANYFGSTPSIDVEKQVWNGTSWDDADTPTGPYLTAANNPVVFRFVITNNGAFNLTNVTLTDVPAIGTFYTDQGLTIPAVFPIPTLVTSASVTVYGSLPWAQGQQTDTATATGIPPVGAPVSDSDPANYSGPPPSIDLEKYVWDGATWYDADTPPGPYLTSEHNPVIFRFVITNNCGVNLTNVTLTDTYITNFYIDQGLTIPATFPIPTLLTSTSVTVYGSLPWAEGQHSNTATATGTPPVGAPVSDSDSSHYYNRPTTVGWETYPVNKLRVLLPWIGLIAAIIAGASLPALRRRSRTAGSDSV
jgi:uncharacterized repeat protein (TIGR01451 family)